MFIIWHWEAFVTPASCSRGIPQMTCSTGCLLCLESFLLGRYARLKNRPDKKQDQGLVEYLWCLVWQDLNMWLALLALSCLLPGHPYQDSKKIDCFPPIEHRCVLRQITTLCQYLYLLADELAENANARNHEECAQVIAGWWRYGIQDPVAILMILVILDWNDFGKGQKVKNLWFHIKLSYSWEDEPIHQGEKVVTRFWSVAISEGLFFSPVEPRFASSLVQRPWSPPSTSSMRTTKAAGDCFVFFDRNLLGRDRFIRLSIDMCHWAVQACVCVCVSFKQSESFGRNAITFTVFAPAAACFGSWRVELTDRRCRKRSLAWRHRVGWKGVMLMIPQTSPWWIIMNHRHGYMIRSVT